MYRRRRPGREKILFSFDSFLDVVANVNGIIIRLILIAFVGGRAYHGSMSFVNDPLPDDAVLVQAPSPAKAEDDPLSKVLTKQRQELAEIRSRLAKTVGAVDETKTEAQAAAAQLAALNQLKDALAKQAQDVVSAASKEIQTAEKVALSIEELRKRSASLKTAFAQIDSVGPPRKELRYHTPVSRTVTSDEIFFECKNGRVTYLDLPGLMRDIEDGLKDKEEQLRNSFSVEDVTRSLGAFRLKYTIVRRRTAGESFGEADRPRDRNYFGYGLGKFVVEPIAPLRGETLDQALKASSDFRQAVDALDSQTVVTFWVYPDSFALFRTLRDYLYERGIEVAGRPLPESEPIGGSPNGSRSRGQ